MPHLPYATLAEARAWLGENTQDHDDDIQAALAAAQGMIISYLGWDPSLGTTTEVVRGTGSTLLFPTRKPIRAVVALTDEYGTTYTARFDDQAVQATAMRFVRDVPYTLTYTAGHEAGSDGFAPLRLATKIAVQAAYGASTLDPNISGENIPGTFSASYAQQGPGALPIAAVNLIEHMRRRY